MNRTWIGFCLGVFLGGVAFGLAYLYEVEQERVAHETQVTAEVETYIALSDCAGMVQSDGAIDWEIVRQLWDDSPAKSFWTRNIRAEFSLFEGFSEASVNTLAVACAKNGQVVEAEVARIEAERIAKNEAVRKANEAKASARIAKHLAQIVNEWEYYRLPPIRKSEIVLRPVCAVAQDLRRLGKDVRSFPDPVWQQVMAVEPWNRRIGECW